MSGSSLEITSRIKWLSDEGTPAAGSSSSRLRPLRKRNGDLDQPLPAIGQFAHRAGGVGNKRKRLQVIERFLDYGAFASGRTPEAIADAISLGDGKIDIVEDAEITEELVHLEGARDAAAGARRLRQRGNVFSVEQHVAG